MAVNYKKLDLLLQYILVVAGQNDEYDRELGMIHLIKYVYLADIAHASRNDGETYTGLPWKFHHFGPWAVECYQRIEPALSAIGATRRIIESRGFDDFVRWSVDDDRLLERIGDQLDLAVAAAVQKYVRRFGTDTYDLLDFVYKTAPMLSTAPEEFLEFKSGVTGMKIVEDDPRSGETERQKKLRRNEFIAFKEKLKKNLEETIKNKRLKGLPTPPRYDNVFFEGLAKLESAAGNLPAEGEYVATFDKDIWKSKARHDPELS